MSMNLNQFLQRLRKTPRDWYVTSDGKIRRTHFWGPDNKYESIECPISTLDHRVSNLWIVVAKMFGIDRSLARKITIAADSNSQPVLRRKLVRACGLKG